MQYQSTFNKFIEETIEPVMEQMEEAMYARLPMSFEIDLIEPIIREVRRWKK